LGLDVLFAGLVFGVLISFLFTYILKYSRRVSVLVWICIVIVFLGFGGCIWAFRDEYYTTIEEECIGGVDVNDCAGYESDIYLFLYYAFMGAAGAYLLLILKFRKKIKYAV